MAGDVPVFIRDPTNKLRPIGDQVLHVQFESTDDKKYKLNCEDLECTLLSKFLKERSKKDFHEMLIKITFDVTAPAQDVKDFCEDVLKRGIYWNQKRFLFLGHSETQLKKKSCYVHNASHEEIHQLLAQFGDFLGEKNVGKRARKIGMLFSPLNRTQPLDTTQYKLEPDIKHGIFRSYTFTDGCGFMSSDFSSDVQRTLDLGYKPSVVQVRYRGIEGLLVLKEDLTDVKVQFHYSMQKFETSGETLPAELNFLDLLDYSRPYKSGYLDNQMIMLLADRGVPLQNLEKNQSHYYGLLEQMCERSSGEYFLSLIGEFPLLLEIKTNGIDKEMKKKLKSLKNKELDEMKKAAGYTRILIPQSREVFAVCDPYNKLKYGECYFNPTIPDDEAESFPGPSQKFVVMRSPCHHPGDVRVLRLTGDKQGYENLRDCLVLPVKGPHPHAFECAGGTVGGDKFFVSWNEELIPNVVEKPCDYPLKKSAGIHKFIARLPSCMLRSLQISPRQKNERGRQEMREYFATFSDDLTERIVETYMKYAAAFGPSSKKCRKLSKMFFQAVNLIEDRVILEKELSKLSKKEPSLKSSDNPSPFTPDEKSRLLSGSVNEERGDVNEHRPDDTLAIKFRRFMLSSGRPLCNPGNEAREKIESTARKFVDSEQRKQTKVA